MSDTEIFPYPRVDMGPAVEPRYALWAHELDALTARIDELEAHTKMIGDELDAARSMITELEDEKDALQARIAKLEKALNAHRARAKRRGAPFAPEDIQLWKTLGASE